MLTQAEPSLVAPWLDGVTTAAGAPRRPSVFSRPVVTRPFDVAFRRVTRNMGLYFLPMAPVIAENETAKPSDVLNANQAAINVVNEVWGFFHRMVREGGRQ
ncbi:hypothetical protein [Burkholderia sp. F1]|uniref:hypothetical protein n=1 Tax=Burkholderia sp. F1 TaxID=3366817 RepID=UPI003D747F8A